jgi:uncharacterized protein (UPF0548 family)
VIAGGVGWTLRTPFGPVNETRVGPWAGRPAKLAVTASERCSGCVGAAVSGMTIRAVLLKYTREMSHRDEDLLRRVSDLALTYPEVGATAPRLDQTAGLPMGYRHIDRSLTLGSGPAVYERACSGLLSWQMHRRAGITVTASAPSAVTGTCAILRIGWRSIAITAPCRVVYDVSTERQQGFAYGTLPGHPEIGEESFIVTHEDDDRVTFNVRAFSRPATLLARAGGPLSLIAQDLVTGRYLRSLRSVANRGP